MSRVPELTDLDMDLAKHNQFKPLVQHSSKRCDWGTPDSLFDPLDEEFGFGLDVAAEAHNTKCRVYYGPDHTLEELRDGLAGDWLARMGTDGVLHRHKLAAFMNPPYSRELKMPIDPWLAKAVEESKKGLTVVGIIPANVQTRWWQAYVRQAYEVRFLTHRVSFDAPAGVEQSSNAGHNVAVVVWKPLRQLGYIAFNEPHYCYCSYREQD